MNVMIHKLVTPKHRPIMAQEFAAWFVDSTTLTFQQIADFLFLHITEVEGIANGFIKIKGTNPVVYGLITEEEISRCEQDEYSKLRIIELSCDTGKKPSYIPVKYRLEKQNAILYMLLHYPTVTNSEMIKLFRTTSKTLNKLRDKIKNSHNETLTPKHPVSVGICTPSDISIVEKKHTKIPLSNNL